MKEAMDAKVGIIRVVQTEPGLSNDMGDKMTREQEQYGAIGTFSLKGGTERDQLRMAQAE